MEAQNLPAAENEVIQALWREPVPGPVRHFLDGELVCSDAVNLLDAIEDESADIVFLDPPFNLGKEYGSKDKKADSLEESEYLVFMRRVLERAVNALAPGGALYVYHLPQWAFQIATLLNNSLSFRHWIAVSMKNGFARGERLYPAHYALLYFTKGEPATFMRPKIAPAKCRHCGGYIKDYGGYVSYVEDGINLSDVWDDLSPVRHAKYKTRKANELPISLMRRVFEISGSPGGVFVDPFVGSGTTLLAAREADMLFISGDHDQQTCDLAYQRLMAPPQTA